MFSKDPTWVKQSGYDSTLVLTLWEHTAVYVSMILSDICDLIHFGKRFHLVLVDLYRNDAIAIGEGTNMQIQYKLRGKLS